MYMTIWSWMSLIMEVIIPELSELSAFELENLTYLTLFTLSHLQILTNQYQTWPQYITHTRCRMSLIMGQIESEHQKLFARIYQHFLLFPWCFLPYHRKIATFEPLLSYCLQMLWTWNRVKFCCLVNGYITIAIYIHVLLTAFHVGSSVPTVKHRFKSGKHDTLENGINLKLSSAFTGKNYQVRQQMCIILWINSLSTK